VFCCITKSSTSDPAYVESSSHLWLTFSFCRFKMALELTVLGSNSHLAACVQAKYKREVRVHSIRLYIAYQRHVLYTEWNMGRSLHQHPSTCFSTPQLLISLFDLPLYLLRMIFNSSICIGTAVSDRDLLVFLWLLDVFLRCV
jgi:hypothetical protein